MYSLVMSIHHATTAAAKLLMCDFLMGSIQEQWHSFPIKTTANAKLRRLRSIMLTWSFADSSLVFRVLSLPALLQAWKASCGLKTQLLLMKLWRGQPEEQERPQLQTRSRWPREELAREHKGKNITKWTILVLTTDQSYLESSQLWECQILCKSWPAGIPDCVQGKGKDYCQVHQARLAPRWQTSIPFTHMASSAYNITPLAPSPSLNIQRSSMPAIRYQSNELRLEMADQCYKSKSFKIQLLKTRKTNYTRQSFRHTSVKLATEESHFRIWSF